MPNALRLALSAAAIMSAPTLAATYVPPQDYTNYLQDRYFQAYGSAGYFGVMDPAGNRLPLNAEAIYGFSGVRSTFDPSSGGGVIINYSSFPRISGNANLKPYADKEVVLRTGFQRRVYANLTAGYGGVDEFVTIRFGLASTTPTSMGYGLFYQSQTGVTLLTSGVLTAANPDFSFAQAFDMTDYDSIGMVFDYRGNNPNEAVYVYAALDYTIPGYTIPDPPPPPPPTVPEPAIWAQLLLGFFASGALLRRRALPA